MKETTMGHFVSVSGQGPGHPFPDSKTSRSGYGQGRRSRVPGTLTLFQTSFYNFQFPKWQQWGSLLREQWSIIQGPPPPCGFLGVFFLGLGYWIFCEVMFEYFSLILSGCKYFLLAVIVTPNDCCHINQIH